MAQNQSSSSVLIDEKTGIPVATPTISWGMPDLTPVYTQQELDEEEARKRREAELEKILTEPPLERSKRQAAEVRERLRLATKPTDSKLTKVAKVLGLFGMGALTGRTDPTNYRTYFPENLEEFKAAAPVAQRELSALDSERKAAYSSAQTRAYKVAEEERKRKSTELMAALHQSELEIRSLVANKKITEDEAKQRLENARAAALEWTTKFSSGNVTPEEYNKAMRVIAESSLAKSAGAHAGENFGMVPTQVQVQSKRPYVSPDGQVFNLDTFRSTQQKVPQKNLGGFFDFLNQFGQKPGTLGNYNINNIPAPQQKQPGIPGAPAQTTPGISAAPGILPAAPGQTAVPPQATPQVGNWAENALIDRQIEQSQPKPTKNVDGESFYAQAPIKADEKTKKIYSILSNANIPPPNAILIRSAANVNNRALLPRFWKNKNAAKDLNYLWAISRNPLNPGERFSDYTLAGMAKKDSAQEQNEKLFKRVLSASQDLPELLATSYVNKSADDIWGLIGSRDIVRWWRMGPEAEIFRSKDKADQERAAERNRVQQLRDILLYSQLQTYMKMQSGVQFSYPEMQMAKRIFPDAARNSGENGLQNSLLLSFYLQAGIWKERFGVDPSDTRFNFVNLIENHVGDLMSRFKEARQLGDQLDRTKDPNEIKRIEARLKALLPKKEELTPFYLFEKEFFKNVEGANEILGNSTAPKNTPVRSNDGWIEISPGVRMKKMI